MKVFVDLLAGPDKQQPTQQDIQKNIDAIDRAVNGEPKSSDFVVLLDTKSILESIKKQLPGY